LDGNIKVKPSEAAEALKLVGSEESIGMPFGARLA